LSELENSLTSDSHQRIVPYAHHPLRRNTQQDEVVGSDMFSEGESAVGEALQEPAINIRSCESDPNTWCKCGECMKMQRDIECVCCHDNKDIKRFQSVFEGTVAMCVTKLADFEMYVLGQTALEMALISHDRYRGIRYSGQICEPNNYRFAAYRQFTLLVHSYLGKDNRIPLPSCVVSRIRKEYPDPNENYVGFRFSTEHFDS
jgi:hypothetical protein